MSLSHRLPAAAAAVDPYYVYAPHPDPQRQGVLTLFVAGLPDDVKPREIHNLFSHRPAFDHCLLEYTGRGNQAVAFVTFFTHEAALSAMTSLNGTIFDPETGDRLHIELAKSTSRRPRGGGEVYRVTNGLTKQKEMLIMRTSVMRKYGGKTRMVIMVTENQMSRRAQKMKIPVIRMNSLWIRVINQCTSRRMSNLSQMMDETSTNDIPPCSTLFIANLGHTCTEDELKEVLSNEPGFHVLKMSRRGGMPVAFADFTDIESSTAAMNSLQGTVLASSDNDGLHIEYARSKMRKS